MEPHQWWSVLGLLAWAVYLGGALAMEVIWRPTQAHIPPGQINVLCARMGARYRWVAAAALAGAGAAMLLAEITSPATLELSTQHGRTLMLLVACWLVLVAGLVTLTFVAHPALHMRDPSTMSPEERAEARERVRSAIRRMDVLLRADILVALVAVLLAASLPSGGLV